MMKYRPLFSTYILSLSFVFLLINILISSSATYAQAEGSTTDSSYLEIQKIKEQNVLNTLKDSLRMVVMREELSKSGKQNIEELEKYKKELQTIKMADSLRLFKQAAAIDSLRQKVHPNYVILYQDTIFSVYSSIGPFDAKHRADNASALIYSLYKGDVFFKDSLRIEKTTMHNNIKYSNKIITTISLDDAIWEKMHIDSLTNMYKNRIEASIIQNRSKHNFENTAIRWAKSAVVVIGFLLALKLLNYLFKKIINKMLRSKRFTSGIKLRNYELINPRLLKRQLIQVIRIINLVLQIVLLYIALSLVFSIFPLTKSWAYTLLNWLYTPLREIGLAFLDFIPNLIKIILIIFLARFVSRLLRFFSYEIQRNILKIKGFHKEWAAPTYRILKLMVYVFAFILIFPLLPGAHTAEFKGVTVFLGILLSLGSTSAVSNTIAGIIITYMRPFKIGDWIKVNDVVGEVIEKTALVTRIRTINNEDITVPNSAILSNHTKNFSSGVPERNLCISIPVNIRYDVPWEKVHELLLEAAKITKDITLNTAPYVFQLKLENNYVSYQLNAFTDKPHRMFHIQSDLNTSIQTVFDNAGIEFIVPQHIQLDNDNNK